MKNVFIILFLFTVAIHIYSTENYKHELSKLENVPVAIDTLEFIGFWDDFRSAFLNCDTVILYSMIDEVKIVDYCILQLSDFSEINNDCSMLSNRNKSRLSEFWERLFSCTYIALLTKYDVKKDLFSKKTAFTKDYRCDIFVEDRRYNALVTFNEDNTISYVMGVYIETEYSTHSIEFKLIFNKKHKEPIKLHKIDCNEMTIMI
jgi:hypothetical protein